MNEKKPSYQHKLSHISRRNMLKMAAGTGAAFGLASCASTEEHRRPAATGGRINQSIAQWCFAEYWNLEKMCQVAKTLGCKSIELVGPNDFATLKR
ncbi:MAG TPA: twin-arginine translocation signal domain-containing protein, partial [Sedimentisphaerales bacterium]|nr:twin-arginine translocation signal domain-containing protein [Sedimentisphaerales bacterium]